MQLFRNAKVVLVKAAQAAGTTAVTTDVIDMSGFDGVAFVGSLAVANAGNFAALQQGSAANLSDAANLAGSKVTPATNGHSFLLDVYRPLKRYVRVSVTRTAETATGDIYAVLYQARTCPVSHGATIAPLQVISPEEGNP